MLKKSGYVLLIGAILAHYVPNGCSPGKKWSLGMQRGTRLARNGHWEHNEKEKKALGGSDWMRTFICHGGI
jgi:hypothetical protein